MAVYTLDKTSGGSRTSEKSETVKITLPKNGSTSRSYTLTGKTSQGKTATITITQRAYIEATTVKQIVSNQNSTAAYLVFDDVKKKDMSVKFQFVTFPVGSNSSIYLFGVQSQSASNGIHLNFTRKSSTSMTITCFAGNSYKNGSGTTSTMTFTDSELDSSTFTVSYTVVTNTIALYNGSGQRLFSRSFSSTFYVSAPQILTNTSVGVTKILSVTIKGTEYLPAKDSSGNVGVWHNGDFYSGNFLVDYEPSIDLDTISATADEGTYTIKITDPDSVGWQLSSDDSNVTFSKTSGTGAATVTVTVAENTALSQRTATISLAHGANSSKVYDTCALTQEARAAINPSMTLTYGSNTGLSSASIPRTETQLTVAVTDSDNIGWAISCDNGITLSDVSFSELYTGAKSITATVSANTSTSQKTLHIYLLSQDGDTLYTTLTITQAAAGGSTTTTNPYYGDTALSVSLEDSVVTQVTAPDDVSWWLYAPTLISSGAVDHMNVYVDGTQITLADNVDNSMIFYGSSEITFETGSESDTGSYDIYLTSPETLEPFDTLVLTVE